MADLFEAANWVAVGERLRKLSPEKFLRYYTMLVEYVEAEETHQRQLRGLLLGSAGES
jgi:hypothetical protein